MKKHILHYFFSSVLLFVLIGCSVILKSKGFHPEYDGETYSIPDKNVLIITTSQNVMTESGKSTGVFASEMTVPYYEFKDANLSVDLGSIKGGGIPIDPTSLRSYIRSDEDKRFLKDSTFQNKVKNSYSISNVDFKNYDVVFFAGGWGAAYDFGQSDLLGDKISDAYYNSNVIFGSLCHGALAFINAKDSLGEPLIKGRKMTGVTQKQLEELKVTNTPLHPEEELRKADVIYVCNSSPKSRDIFSTLTVVDDEKRFVTGQNQNSGHETAQEILKLLLGQKKADN
jgi:putative intracellular protease/amidase